MTLGVWEIEGRMTKDHGSNPGEENSMLEMIRRFLKEDDGASMAEYAILLAVITGALVTILGLYTESMSNIFNFIKQKLDEAHNAASS